MSPTIAPSTQAAAKDALRDILVTLFAAEPDVGVTWGEPIYELPREWVKVANITGRQATAVVGSRHREETFTLTVVISILEETGDIESATKRAYELAALLEVDLRFNHTSLNNTVRTALVTDLDLVERRRGATGEAELTVSLECRSRI